MRGPDCQTDHYLIKTTFKFNIKPAYSRATTQRKRRLDTSMLGDRRCQDSLKHAINSALEGINVDSETPDQMWDSLSKPVFSAAAEVLGYTKKRNADWFNENDQEIRRKRGKKSSTTSKTK